MRIVILGAPGAGKGTQSDYITENLKITHISTGALFRSNIKEQTELGKKVQAIISRGELVSDDIVIEMVMQRIAQDDCRRGYILDGFPRTLAQAKALTEALKEKGEAIDCAITVNVPDESIIDRMSTRVVCPKCEAQYNTKSNPPKVSGICDRCGEKLVSRADDNPETVKKRLDIYHADTEPIIEYYRSEGVLADIDGTKAPLEVFKEILEALVHYGNN